jgi:U3 small nucleolar RNA-associated protein 18
MPKKSKEKTGSVMEKDQEELELEKVVFGDIEGFEDGLRALDLETYGLDDAEDEDRDLEVEASDVDNDESPALQDDQLFYVDDGIADKEEEGSDNDIESESESETSEVPDEELLDIHGGSAAWIDSDDENMQVSLLSSDRLKKLRKTVEDDNINGREYSRRLRSRFEKIYPVPKWAKDAKIATSLDAASSDSDEAMSGVDESEEDSSTVVSNPLKRILQTKSTYTSEQRSKLLPPSVIDISRLRDANAASVSKAAIQSLQFHPSHPLLLSGGYDRTLRLYHIDGKHNPVATSLHVRDSPFQTARFHTDGRRVFAAGRRRYMYIWDIETGSVDKITRLYGHSEQQRSMEKFELSPCGRYVSLVGSSGWVNVLSASNGQWITGAKVEGSIADVAWASDGDMLSIANTGGDIWEWDARARAFSSVWKDQGGIGITTLALGGRSDRWCAVGSNSGIVNVYDRKNQTVAMKLSESEPDIMMPRYTLDQLVTTISSLEFSADGQVLAMGSRATRDAFRLVHVPSYTVFKNWPTSGTPLGKVTAVAFSPGSEMLCCGNEGGHARLWKLNHYT